jgi:hypothetical protein
MASSSAEATVTLGVPKTMRAWRVVRRGHPIEALEQTSSALVSSDLEDGEVLIKVGAAALNPAYAHMFIDHHTVISLIVAR